MSGTAWPGWPHLSGCDESCTLITEQEHMAMVWGCALARALERCTPEFQRYALRVLGFYLFPEERDGKQ